MPIHRSSRATLLAALGTLATSPAVVHGQHEGHGAPMASDSAYGQRRNMWHLIAQAIPVVTHAANTAEGADLTEGYVTQAAAMGRGDLLSGHLRLEATLNAEGLTMARGELSTGAFGEGYVDRRHPHTYLHELVASALGAIGPLAFSLSAGRGFAAFGTDDPMMRPFEKYPINHHLSQILERPMVTGAIRVGAAVVDASAFGGDEPTSPSSTPLLRRLGDSWSVRVTAMPLSGVEIQGSYARVASPEQREGFGLDQRKRSVSARLVSGDGGRYLLAEWARTVDWDHGRKESVFTYESALVEGAATIGAVSVALRFEQTERAEEERTSDPFRVPRPAPDLGISGITRWRHRDSRADAPLADLRPDSGVSIRRGRARERSRERRAERLRCRIVLSVPFAVDAHCRGPASFRTAARAHGSIRRGGPPRAVHPRAGNKGRGTLVTP